MLRSKLVAEEVDTRCQKAGEEDALYFAKEVEQQENFTLFEKCFSLLPCLMSDVRNDTATNELSSYKACPLAQSKSISPTTGEKPEKNDINYGQTLSKSLPTFASTEMLSTDFENSDEGAYSNPEFVPADNRQNELLVAEMLNPEFQKTYSNKKKYVRLLSNTMECEKDEMAEPLVSAGENSLFSAVQNASISLLASLLLKPLSTKMRSPVFQEPKKVGVSIQLFTPEKKRVIVSSEAAMRKLSFLSGVFILLLPYLITDNNYLSVPVVASTLVAFQASLMALIAMHKRPKIALFFQYTAVCAMVLAMCFFGLSTVLWALQLICNSLAIHFSVI